MKTLRELRTQAGILQAEIAKLIGTNTPQISNYENSLDFPLLEDMFVIENYFGERIDWNEKYSLGEKFQINQNLIDLMHRYPTEAVLEFASRIYRRERNPEKLIKFYANQATKDDIEPLININQ